MSRRRLVSMRESFQEYCYRLQRHDLLKEWDSEKNGEVTPADISFGARNKIWWRCKNNHSWPAPVYSRTTNQAGCPYCTRKTPLSGETDFQTEYHRLAKQWHPELNGLLTPADVMPSSHKAVWWKCSESHVWKTVVYSRTRKKRTGCPVCAGKLRKVRQYAYKEMEYSETEQIFRAQKGN